ncbi:hypothetical protein WJX72_001722 [[Myrmecia] bisecta]|uniref:Uncharacterized protein n=1 Tax=[Myrmecia] bisecta TaxID=41462 RepID=A0AAW1R4X3_9CHLO
MEQLLVACGLVATLLLVLLLVHFWWRLLWHTTMSKFPVFQELFGKRKQNKASKEQSAAEIARVRRQHSRHGPVQKSSSFKRSNSLGRSGASGGGQTSPSQDPFPHAS